MTGIKLEYRHPKWSDQLLLEMPMYSSIVWYAYRAWVSLSSLHTTTGVDPVRRATCFSHKGKGISLSV